MTNFYRLSSVFRRVTFTFLTFVGLTYSRQSKVSEIHDLFRRLWPIQSDHELHLCGHYLIPKDLGKIDALFSPGVGPDSNFELIFAKQGVPCYLADASIDKAPIDHFNIHFLKKFIGPKTDSEFISLDDWVNSYYPEGNNAILQMDIEGAEYRSISSASIATLKKFKLIVIEVHYLNFLTSQEGLCTGSIFFDRLLENFSPVHFHINNYLRPIKFKYLKFPSDIELTLIRNDLITQRTPVEELPHELDIVSNPKKHSPSMHKQFISGVITS